MAGRFAILADEHVPGPLVQALRKRGWVVERVIDVADLGQGADDAHVFAYASERAFVVLSSDERALWRPRQHRLDGTACAGMLCWPQRHRNRMTIGEAVEVIEALALEDDPFQYGYRFIQPRS